MRIIILGAGQIGRAIIENLIDENNDITIVDSNSDNLRKLQDKFDLRTIQGHASYPHILSEAGAQDAEMIIAVTRSDETNMIACQVAYSLFKTPNRIARIRSSHYVRESAHLFNTESIPIDHLITPEKLVTDNLYKLIEYPGALQVVSFAQGKISLLSIKACHSGPLVGNTLSSLKKRIPNIDTKVAAIFRKNRTVDPQGSTIIEDGDEVFFVVASQHIRSVMSEMQSLEKPYKRIMIVGGGNIGAKLAHRLEKEYNVKLIERDHARAEELAEYLQETIVFCGDASDQELLKEEQIDQTDAFIAITNNDAVNIMSAMLAKRMGAKKTLALIEQREYMDLMQDSIIDITMSPQQATISELLAYVRKANIVNSFSLRRSGAEAIEAIAYGDESTSHVVGRNINAIRLPSGTVVGAIARGNEVIIPNKESYIKKGDHIIMFLTDKKFISDIERLFQSNSGFE